MWSHFRVGHTTCTTILHQKVVSKQFYDNLSSSITERKTQMKILPFQHLHQMDLNQDLLSKIFTSLRPIIKYHGCRQINEFRFNLHTYIYSDHIFDSMHIPLTCWCYWITWSLWNKKSVHRSRDAVLRCELDCFSNRRSILKLNLDTLLKRESRFSRTQRRETKKYGFSSVLDRSSE